MIKPFRHVRFRVLGNLTTVPFAECGCGRYRRFSVANLVVASFAAHIANFHPRHQPKENARWRINWQPVTNKTLKPTRATRHSARSAGLPAVRRSELRPGRYLVHSERRRVPFSAVLVARSSGRTWPRAR